MHVFTYGQVKCSMKGFVTEALVLLLRYHDTHGSAHMLLAWLEQILRPSYWASGWGLPLAKIALPPAQQHN